jgi:hypothetical protein
MLDSYENNTRGQITSPGACINTRKRGPLHRTFLRFVYALTGLDMCSVCDNILLRWHIHVYTCKYHTHNWVIRYVLSMWGRLIIYRNLYVYNLNRTRVDAPFLRCALRLLQKQTNHKLI